MKYMPVTVWIVLGMVAVAVACFVTHSAMPLWGLVLVGIGSEVLMPKEPKN